MEPGKAPHNVLLPSDGKQITDTNTVPTPDTERITANGIWKAISISSSTALGIGTRNTVREILSTSSIASSFTTSLKLNEEWRFDGKISLIPVNAYNDISGLVALVFSEDPLIKNTTTNTDTGIRAGRRAILTGRQVQSIDIKTGWKKCFQSETAASQQPRWEDYGTVSIVTLSAPPTGKTIKLQAILDGTITFRKRSVWSGASTATKMLSSDMLASKPQVVQNPVNLSLPQLQYVLPATLKPGDILDFSGITISTYLKPDTNVDTPLVWCTFSSGIQTALRFEDDGEERAVVYFDSLDTLNWSPSYTKVYTMSVEPPNSVIPVTRDGPFDNLVVDRTGQTWLRPTKDLSTPKHFLEKIAIIKQNFEGEAAKRMIDTVLDEAKNKVRLRFSEMFLDADKAKDLWLNQIKNGILPNFDVEGLTGKEVVIALSSFIGREES